MRSDDGELVVRARAGDRGAFEALVEQYRDAVSGVCYSYLGNFDDVQDAAQEAFVQAYLHLDDLKDAAKFGPWLRMIASNVSKALLRRRKPDLALDDVAEPASSAMDAQRSAVRMVVRDALARLSEKTRLTVTLSYINGYSHDEVANLLEVPVNTVRSRLRIAKTRLREEMIAMVSDVLHEDKPDPELTKRVMEAIARLPEVRRRGPIPALARAYDESMRILRALESGAAPEQVKFALVATMARTGVNPDETKLVLDMLSTLAPDDVLPAMQARLLVDRARLPFVKTDEMRALVEEAERLAGRVREGSALALLELSLASGYDTLGQREAVWHRYERALVLARRFGNRRAEGMSLQLMAIEHLRRNETPLMAELLRQSLPVLDDIGVRDWAAVSRSLLMMYEDVGKERFESLLFRAANCDRLVSEEGMVYQDPGTFGWQPGFGWTHWDEIHAGRFFWAGASIGGPGRFPYAMAPVGTTWTEETFSYTERPRTAAVTVISRDESVTTPAGAFDRCLLLEQASFAEEEPDDAPERERWLNQVTTPTTLRWYAPRVGLVQLRARSSDGMESLTQLTDYTLTQPSNDIIPLAIGNSWTYDWTGTPEDCSGKEFHRIAASEGSVWYLEHYAYVYRKGQSAR